MLLVIVVAAVSYAFEFADMLALGSVSAPVQKELGISLSQFGTVVSATYLGLMIGASSAGWIADRWGRKRILIAGHVVTALASLAAALATGQGSLLIARLAGGIGMGTLYVIALTYLVELVPSHRRGAAVAGTYFVGSLAVTGITAFARVVVPSGPDGWRFVFGIGVIGILTLFALFRLPESPTWLKSRGLREEAEAAVAKLERAATRGGTALPEPVATVEPAAPAGPGSPATTFLRAGLVHPLVLLMLIWIAQTAIVQLMATWVPTILGLRGFSVERSLTVSTLLTIGTLVGSLAATFLAKRVQGLRAAVVLASLCAVAGGLLGFTGDVTLVILCGSVHAILFGVFSPLLNRITSEQWPTELRGRGSGLAYSAGRLAAIALPLTFTAVVSSLGPDAFGWALIVFWSVVVLGCAALAQLRRNRRGSQGSAQLSVRQLAKD
ncbi:putative MFS transporter [Amycolatopsis bartoniae]|uniref:MFS transporter n=1 Tax=Amycolatopsis bartoniae TaxID=941986 RepID=UPI0016059733|nr:MFS transporter [Amycolatopsis bartoniae]MBB2940231.1 putative MFS transporter [Amycolatopsis bartoniae]